jgi:hypothetical protein
MPARSVEPLCCGKRCYRVGPLALTRHISPSTIAPPIMPEQYLAPMMEEAPDAG